MAFEMLNMCSTANERDYRLNTPRAKFYIGLAIAAALVSLEL